MQSGSIEVIATDEGAGVNSSGQMITSAGDIVIDANGSITLANADSADGITIDGKDVNLSGGNLAANGAIAVESESLLLDSSDVSALDEIQFDTTDFDSLDSDITADTLTILSDDQNYDATTISVNNATITGDQVDFDAEHKTRCEY